MLKGKYGEMFWFVLAILGFIVGLYLSYLDLLWSADGWNSAMGQNPLIGWAFSFITTVVEGPILIYAKEQESEEWSTKAIWAFIALVIIYDVGTNVLGVWNMNGPGMFANIAWLVTAMKLAGAIGIAFIEYFEVMCLNSAKYHKDTLNTLLGT